MKTLNLNSHPLSTVTSPLPGIAIPLSCRVKAPFHFMTDWINLEFGLDAAGSEVIYARCRGESFLLSSTPITLNRPVYRTYSKNWVYLVTDCPRNQMPRSIIVNEVRFPGFKVAFGSSSFVMGGKLHQRDFVMVSLTNREFSLLFRDPRMSFASEWVPYSCLPMPAVATIGLAPAKNRHQDALLLGGESTGDDELDALLATLD